MPDKYCVVAYADRARQYLWPVALPAEATIGDAIDAARSQAPDVDVPWDSAPVGIFGEPRTRADVPADGDRIELYRPLRDDPKARRRAQSARRPKANKQAAQGRSLGREIDKVSANRRERFAPIH